MKLGSATLFVIAALSCSVARATDAVEHVSGAPKNVEQDDAEFWERFLGNYKKKKKVIMSTDSPTQAPTLPKNCRTNVTVTCEAPDPITGELVDCSEIFIPNGDCTSDTIETVSFTFQPAPCIPSGNEQEGCLTGVPENCADIEEVPDDSPVIISCTETDTGNFVPVTTTPGATGSPSVTVNPGQEFYVNPQVGGPIPTPVNCTISNLDGDLLQWNLMDLSGDCNLDVKDSFGSLVLESCDETDCLINATLTYIIFNTGDTDMEVLNVTGQVNSEEPFQLVDDVVPNPIPEGASVTVFETVQIDFCLEAVYLICAYVDARPPGGNTECEADFCLEVPINPFTPAPTDEPTFSPTEAPSDTPSQMPSGEPSQSPSRATNTPTNEPTTQPSLSPSSSPSLLPSSTPTLAPSLLPSSTPSLSPSGEPSQSPSRATNTPTNEPTEQPSTTPSSTPSTTPSESPTEAPPCETTLGVECTVPDPITGETILCENNLLEDGDCFGGPIGAISLSYKPKPCGTPTCTNGQEGVTGVPEICDDGINPPSGCADIECRDTNSGVLLPLSPFGSSSGGTSINVCEGDVFSVRPVGRGGVLPSPINCTIEDSSGNLMQWNLIDVSGSVALQLKDCFGSLEMEACDDKECLQESTLTYFINNVGETDMQVVNVTGQVDNQPPFQLVDEVDPNPVPIGQTVTVTEVVVLDYCEDFNYTVCGYIDARPDNTSPDFCEAEVCIIVNIDPFTARPTMSPSEVPTQVPSLSPSTTPSGEPSQSPTSKPTDAPTNTPSESPSDAPTDTPSESPSETPTSKPTDEPTLEPTFSPTASPTSSPTASPTLEPTFSPTVEPTFSPTSSPVQQCKVGVLLPNETIQFGGNITVPCQNRLELLTMQYTGNGVTGGACNRSFFCEGNQFICQDFGNSFGTIGVDGLAPDQVWVQAYGVNDPAISFSGVPSFDEFGDAFFNLTGPNQLELDADQIVDYYERNPTTGGPIGNPIQRTQFHVSCSQPLVCYNVFGASTVVGYQEFAPTPLEQYKSCAASQEVDIDLEIPLDIPGTDQDVEVLVFLVVLKPGPGAIPDPDNPIEVIENLGIFTISAGTVLPLDYTLRLDPRITFLYRITVLIQAQTVPGGLPCIADPQNATQFVNVTGVSTDVILGCEDFRTTTPRPPT